MHGVSRARAGQAEHRQGRQGRQAGRAGSARAGAHLFDLPGLVVVFDREVGHVNVFHVDARGSLGARGFGGGGRLHECLLVLEGRELGIARAPRRLGREEEQLVRRRLHVAVRPLERVMAPARVAARGALQASHVLGEDLRRLWHGVGGTTHE
jgi:hypothetical protein